MDSYQSIVSTKGDQKEEETIKIVTWFEEVEWPIAKLRSGKVVGPDTVPTDLFIQAGDSMKAAFHCHGQRAITGYVENSRRKHGKSDHYSPNSYRPISDESYIEGNCLIGAEQEGFRKKHATVNAILKLTNSLSMGLRTTCVRQPSEWSL